MTLEIAETSSISVPGFGFSQRVASLVSSVCLESITTKSEPFLIDFFNGTASTFCSLVGFPFTTKKVLEFSKEDILLVEPAIRIYLPLLRARYS